MRRIFFISSFCAVFLLLGSVARAEESKDPLGLDTITLDEITAHMKWLCDPARKGRNSGTEQGFVTEDYVAREFKSIGLEPGGDNGTFYQQTDVGPAVGNGPNSALALEVSRGGRARALSLKPDVHFAAQKGSPAKAVSGDLCFAGYGISADRYDYDDYADLDPSGKIVIVLRGEPQEKDAQSRFRGKRKTRYSSDAVKVAQAQKRGAKAVLLVHNRNWKADDVPVSVFTVAGRRSKLRIPVLHVSRKVVALALRADGKNLEEIEKAIDAEYAPKSFILANARVKRLRADAQVRYGRNVIGILRGNDPALSKELVVCGAHADHLGYGGFGSRVGAVGQLHPGADDNASGTAALMEVAEACAKARVRPRRSIMFIAFASEEKGLLGAGYYVNHPHPDFPISSIDAMINMDMVGYLRKNRVTLLAADSSKDKFFEKVISAGNRRLGSELDLAFPSFASGGSDQMMFISKKVPSVFFHTGTHKYYHTPQDTFDRINLPGMLKVARLVAATTEALASYPKRPEFKAMPGGGFGGRRRGPLVGINVGGPDPDDEDPIPGVYVSAVMEGYASEDLGLEDGDIIVGMDGAAIKEVRDLQRALSKKKLGDPIKVTWIRDGKKMSAKATLKDPNVKAGKKEAGKTPDEAGLVLDEAWASMAQDMLGLKNIKPGDRIIKVNGKEVSSPAEIQNEVMSNPEKVTITWIRDGKTMSETGGMEAPAGSEPDEEPSEEPKGPGILVTEQLLETSREMLHLRRLRVGDRIVAAGGKAVHDLEELQNTVLLADPEKGVKIEWTRGGKRMSEVGKFE